MDCEFLCEPELPTGNTDSEPWTKYFEKLWSNHLARVRMKTCHVLSAKKWRNL